MIEPNRSRLGVGDHNDVLLRFALAESAQEKELVLELVDAVLADFQLGGSDVLIQVASAPAIRVPVLLELEEIQSTTKLNILEFFS